MICQHELVTSTVKAGLHCADCKEPLVSLLIPISRNTPAGQVLAILQQSHAAILEMDTE